MKISELIRGLADLQTEHGDVEVFTEEGCGCCIWSRDVDPQYSEEDRYEDLIDTHQPGVYL